MTRTSRTISLLLVVLVLVLTAVTVYTITSEAHSALRQSSQEELMDVATAIATQINGTSFARIQPGDEGTPGFLLVRDQLHRVKGGTSDIHFIYTMRRDGPGVVFVVDGDYGFTGDTAKIGQPYPQAEPELFAGFSGPSVDKEFTTDQWGTVLSGFAPIRDTSGAVVGIVGVDMDSSDVAAAINRLNIIVSIVGLLAVFLAALGIFVVDHRRAVAEQAIEESEQKYRALFERAGDAIFLLDAEGPVPGRIVAANASAADMHGYSPAELETMTIAHLDVPGAPVTATETIHGVLNSGWIHGERLHSRKDGTVFPIEFSASPLTIGQKKYILVIDRDVTDRKKDAEAFQRTTNKLNMLNTVTFSDIQNTVYSIDGYLTLGADSCDGKMKEFNEKEQELVRRLRRTLDFARNYRDLGTKPPTFQDVERVFLFAVSHLDMSAIQRTIELDGLEIYADSLLERVFQALADNVITKGKTATKLALTYSKDAGGLTIVFEDNGVGIQASLKEAVFERGFGTQKAMELFLVREILGITGITIRETGTPGAGARFEIHVPPGEYRFAKKS